MKRYPGVVVLVFALVAVTALNIGFTAWWVQRQGRLFCDVVGSTVDGYRQDPPVSPVGRTQQRNAEDLYRKLGCR